MPNNYLSTAIFALMSIALFAAGYVFAISHSDKMTTEIILLFTLVSCVVVISMAALKVARNAICHRLSKR